MNDTIPFDGSLHHLERAHSRRREEYVHTKKQQRPKRLYGTPSAVWVGTHERLVLAGRRLLDREVGQQILHHPESRRQRVVVPAGRGALGKMTFKLAYP